ncbi:MAG TPA: hypothetical protein VFN51_02695 [Candidatus Saccharimonadales bacterium]|nr:hypothetical protein [Candidatus Saccharimonadales bacterium]
MTESFSQATKLGFNGLNLSIPSLTYMATGMAMVAAFIFFMGIDLVRYIPRAAAITSKTSATSTPATSSGSTTTPTSTGSNTTGSSTTPSSSSSPSSSQSYYSPPVSSVS